VIRSSVIDELLRCGRRSTSTLVRTTRISMTGFLITGATC